MCADEALSLNIGDVVLERGREGLQVRETKNNHQRMVVLTPLIKTYPEQIVSRMLGHRDPRSMRRYAEVNEDQVRVALAARRFNAG